MGLTVLDAGVVIGVLDSWDQHHDGAVQALRLAVDRRDELVFPASAYSEALVAPSRRGPEAIATVDALLTSLPARVEPITAEIAKAAAQLRADHGQVLKLPDALVLATAKVLAADWVVTTDRRWPSIGVDVEEIG